MRAPVVSSGLLHSAFVDAGGQLLTCGKNLGFSEGEGEGAKVSAVPRAVIGVGGVRIRTVAAGSYQPLACSDEGVA